MSRTLNSPQIDSNIPYFLWCMTFVNNAKEEFRATQFLARQHLVTKQSETRKLDAAIADKIETGKEMRNMYNFG